MKNLFEQETIDEVIGRIDSLQPGAQRQWGKMDVAQMREFHQGGEAKCTRHPHPFFGALTPAEWSRGMYKHLDHHLRQFGV